MTLKTENIHKSLDFLGQGILKNWVVQVLTSDPATTYARIYFNSVSGKWRGYNTTNSVWEDLGSSDEYIQDLVAAMLVAGNNIDITYNDGAGTITIDVEALTSADISDFDTQVRTNRLDQMAAPTTSVSLNSHLITNVLDPVSAQDAATKTYVDALAQGLAPKDSVRVATTAAGTLASSFENGDTVDGITLATGDRILIKDQSSGAENGIYVVAASGAPTRALDADSSNDLRGASVWVEEGTANADTGWVLTTNAPITVNTTALSFTQNSGLGQVTSGSGLTKSGNTLNVGAGSGITVNADDIALASSSAGAGLTYTSGVLDVGAGTGISVAADSVAIDTSVVVRKYVGNIGDGSTADIVVTHNLGTRDVIVAVVNAGSPYDVQDVYWEATSTNTVTIFFVTAPASNAYRVIVNG